MLALSIALLSGCSKTGNEAAGKTVKIGVIAPMSGDAAAFGEEKKALLDFLLADVNAEYKEKGYQFELVYEDGKCSGQDSVTAFQKLTDIDGVSFIIGGICSSETLGFAPLLEDKNVIAFSATSSSPELEGKSKNLFSLSYNDNVTAEGIASELGKYKKVAFISEQNDYNQALKKGVESVLAEKYPDTEIVVNEEFSKGNTEFRNPIQKIKNSGAEALLINPNAGVTAEALVKQMGEVKDWNIAKVGPFPAMTANVIAAAPEVTEGAAVFDAPGIDSPEFKALMEKITAANLQVGTLGNYYTASIHDSLQLAAEIISQTQDAVTARDMLRNGTFSGIIGKIEFGDSVFVKNIGTSKYVITNSELVKVSE